jgi:hypothetical protein
LEDFFRIMVVEDQRHDEPIDPPCIARKQPRKFLSIQARHCLNAQVIGHQTASPTVVAEIDPFKI